MTDLLLSLLIKYITVFNIDFHLILPLENHNPDNKIVP